MQKSPWTVSLFLILIGRGLCLYRRQRGLLLFTA